MRIFFFFDLKKTTTNKKYVAFEKSLILFCTKIKNIFIKKNIFKILFQLFVIKLKNINLSNRLKKTNISVFAKLESRSRNETLFIKRSLIFSFFLSKKKITLSKKKHENN